MGVLESPITWIVVAAVLVVVAILLLVLAAARRRRARRAAAAAAWPPPALEASRPNPDAPWTGPTPVEELVRVSTRRAVSTVPGRPEADAATRYAQPDTAPLDVDTIRARLAAEPTHDAEPAAEQVAAAGGTDRPEPAEPGRPAALHRPYAPSVPSGASATPDPGPHRPRHAAAGTPDSTADTTTADTTADPRPDAAESAKDRLLGVLLRDPQAAIAALDAAGRDDTAPGEGDVTALLRAGLSPAQVARLVGRDEGDLATAVARSLGLLPGVTQAGGGVATGENRTDDPGRSCANAASSAGSTTPTTG
ncbi:hypothetical protein PHK61_19690 [Actinomycetospora lutea]|uniref:hypothetical protein n=1 Tax=Actinomycetospora lutea TaxID=663604 RepID=UPI002365E05D|nr:hypothetical protein [Actinomycetospora lutea]MDD7940651.1 hypothetical protein [Actinomycetospora lutea]